MKNSFFDYTLDRFTTLLVEQELNKFAAHQIFDWVYKKRVYDPEKWSNIAKATRLWLKENIDFSLPKIVWNGLSSDGTRKFLVAFQDQQTVEAVAIPARDRLTLCLSSQVGCAIGCTFCHTATQGLKRHLKPHEVVGQYMAVQQWLFENISPEERLTNIVYMGQGEPLHNFENMKSATEIFLEPRGLGLGQRRITLSTSGLVPAIEKLINFPPINIAISLHAAHNNIRTELMPINKVYDLERLFKAIKTIPLKAYRRITYEYLLIENLNDQREDVEALTKLLSRAESKINLIPFNEYPGSKYKRPSAEKIYWFMQQLQDRGLTCTVRTTKGTDILAACGQLKSAFDDGSLNLWQPSHPIANREVDQRKMESQTFAPCP
jgi:23S rRNA (adenine2503-C2)-methyltransferase